MTEIDLLNQRLREGLGEVLGGSQGRFKWVQSQDCFYYIRSHIGENFRRKCWADRSGKCWVLAQWRLPMTFDGNHSRVLTKEDWWKTFQGTMPYPERGGYEPHMETKLPPGCRPTAEITANYIWTLRQQMETSYTTQVLDGHAEMALEQKRLDDEFWQTTADLEPAFGNYNSGSRDSSVSFGGVYERHDSQATQAS